MFICTASITSTVKAGVLCDEELEELAVSLGDQWKVLGRRLGITRSTLATIDDEDENYSEKAYIMLLVWKRRERGGATYKVLQEALRHRLVGLASLAEKFCK